MSCHIVVIDETDESYSCQETRTVLDGMTALGRKGFRPAAVAAARGVCKIEIVAGEYSKGVMSRDHVSAEEEAQNIVLACRVKPTSDMRLRVLGKMKKQVLGR